MEEVVNEINESALNLYRGIVGPIEKNRGHLVVVEFNDKADIVRSIHVTTNFDCSKGDLVYTEVEDQVYKDGPIHTRVVITELAKLYTKGNNRIRQRQWLDRLCEEAKSSGNPVDAAILYDHKQGIAIFTYLNGEPCTEAVRTIPIL